MQFTVIIPAHNEAQVIERCLACLLEGAPDNGKMQIIVAANGCNDKTASIARASAPNAIVLELAEGSKPRAMNAAKAIAEHPICIFLDADVRCDYSSLDALAKTLAEPGVMAASPALRMDLSRSNGLVNAYYRVWLNLPYITDRMVGSGCFGLSTQAMRRLGDFPAIIGDDVWVRSRLEYSERRTVSESKDGTPAFFIVSPPRSLLDQIRVETRRRIGNKQVDALIAHDAEAQNHRGAHSWSDIVNTRNKGASWFDICVYLCAKAAVIARTEWSGMRGAKPQWERDLAAREV
ncbi:MAG: glycosyltransferase [Pseudomonadota bacterium]